MRRLAWLAMGRLVCGLLLVGVGLLWRGGGAAPGRVHASEGLLIDTPTVSVSETATPPGATATATATPTSTIALTPTATPTTCSITFVDVPPDNTFYAYVRCLSCRGIVGGYPCGGPGEPCPGQYFRPGNNVTRGQTSKIVALAAGIADPIPSIQQRFEDVAPGSTFWLWIEQLAGRGIVGGYACGEPSEPCVGPTNRSYFRPNNDVTRGQLAKIVAGTAAYSETPTGQTFEDVPPGSTFYLWVEQIAARETVGGYPCGGAGEPCQPPANRPYFRPNNNATRGQMSKIAAQSFAITWGLVPSANPGADTNFLRGIAVVSATDIWAVGTFYDNALQIFQTLVEHWDGAAWQAVPSPNVGPYSNQLNSVAVVSANDIWAAGMFDDGTTTGPMVAHWNGTSWSTTSVPSLGGFGNLLYGIAAVSANDVWAVGSWYTSTGFDTRTLVEHWNGITWDVVPSPSPGTVSSDLLSVAAVSANDVWAVGSLDNGNGPLTLVEHWNGVHWSVVPSPSPGTVRSALAGVAVVSARDVWAVGDYRVGNFVAALIEHWDGTSWSVVSSPNPGTLLHQLQGVTARSSSDVWAVGLYYHGSIRSTLVEHWNGTSWIVVPSPNGGDSNELIGVAASAGDVWAVGYFDTPTDEQTLIAHYPQACP